MNKKRLWISVIFVGIVGLFIISRIFAPKPIEKPNVETPPVSARDELRRGEEATIGSVPAGWQKIDGGSFTIYVLETWYTNFATKNDGSVILQSITSDTLENMFRNLDEAMISVYEFPKTEKSFEQVLEEKIKGPEEAESAVEFFKTVTNDPFNKLTIDDIKTSVEEIALNNGTTVTKNIFQCLKVCDLDGGPYTLIQYFIDTDKNVYLFSGLTGIDETAGALQLINEQIVKTFEVK